MTLPISSFAVKTKLLQKATYGLKVNIQCTIVKRHQNTIFKKKKSDSVKSPVVHFTLKNSADQDLEGSP